MFLLLVFLSFIIILHQNVTFAVFGSIPFSLKKGILTAGGP